MSKRRYFVVRAEKVSSGDYITMRGMRGVLNPRVPAPKRWRVVAVTKINSGQLVFSCISESGSWESSARYPDELMVIERPF